jgi:hypothetical protein
MSPGLHGELARASEREGTSLNGYIIARLTESVGSAVDGGESQRSPGRGELRTVTWLLVANIVAVSFAGLAALLILLVAL